jgi:hypothetical protein
MLLLVKELDAAVAALRQDPTKPVRAKVLDMTIELRAVPEERTQISAAEAFARLGSWEGESEQELMNLFATDRAGNRSVSGF